MGSGPEALGRQRGSFGEGASFAQQMDGCTAPKPANVPKPQSVPAITRSLPTISAYCTMRWATSSGCSTMFEVESRTPGTSTLSSGSLCVANTSHSCPCRALAPSMSRPIGLAFSAVGSTLASGDVVRVRPGVVAPADVQAHAIGGQVAHGVVQRLDLHLGVAHELVVGVVAEQHVPAHRRGRGSRAAGSGRRRRWPRTRAPSPRPARARYASCDG